MKEKELMKCKICGKVFEVKGIGKHVWNKHSIVAKDYYERINLCNINSI